MASNELLEIRMKLLGASQVAHEGERAGRGISKVGGASERTARKTGVLSRAYSRLSSAAKYGLLAIGTTGVFFLKSAIEKTTELAKTTTGLSRNLGITTQEASRWGAVAEARGIDTKQLAGVFSILSAKSVEAARKGGTLLTPFHQLGITQQELIKHGGDFNWILLRTAKALGDETGGTKRMTAAKSVLGKGYATLLPLFSDGAKGLKEQLHWADKYGVTLDTKTNDKIMAFVTAQRESKVAMLGLKVGLASTLMPVLSDAEGEFQQFVRVLNSDLTTEQKINHVSKMFERLEDTLIKFIADALPKVAESGGKLGLALAGAIWTGFKNSNLAGKLVITAWLLKYMGAGGLIKKVAGAAGGAIAKAIGTRMLAVMGVELAEGEALSTLFRKRFSAMGQMSGRMFAIGMAAGLVLLGFFIAEQVDKKTHGAFRKWSINAAENFINAFIWVVNKGISAINSVLNDANVLSFLGVSAPQFGHVGEVNLHNEGSKPVPRGPLGKSRTGFNPANPQNPFGIGERGGRKEQMRTTGPTHIHLHMNGKEIAYGLLREGENAAALA